MALGFSTLQFGDREPLRVGSTGAFQTPKVSKELRAYLGSLPAGQRLFAFGQARDQIANVLGREASDKVLKNVSDLNIGDAASLGSQEGSPIDILGFGSARFKEISRISAARRGEGVEPKSLSKAAQAAMAINKNRKRIGIAALQTQQTPTSSKKTTLG